MSLQNLHQRLGKNLVWIVVMNTILSLIAAATTSATLGFVVYERVMRHSLLGKAIQATRKVK